MSSIFFIWDFHLTKENYGEIKSKPCASFMCNKYTVFTMGGTVALRSVNKIFPESYSSAASFIQDLKDGCRKVVYWPQTLLLE